MKYVNPALVLDYYKISHRSMYPSGMETCYSTWTPRASRVKGLDKVVHFGTQAFLVKLNETWNKGFFKRPKAEVIGEYARIIKNTLGVAVPETKHLEDLHDLGFLPLAIKALPEGTVVPVRVPVMTIENTDPRFFWLTNYLETFASCELWQASTSATLAREYRRILDKYAMLTVGNTEFVPFQGHDFSMRGMSSLESAVLSGMGHLTQFAGTDTVPAIQAVEKFYGGNVEKELIGTSIPATEHSIQCAYGDDMEYLERMMTVVHPSGFVSIVSDGYDFWDVIGRVIPALKEKIYARDGRVVIRPDSGDPVKIICGDPDATPGSLEFKGAVEALWDIFGGTMTDVNFQEGTDLDRGYRLLDSHIGLIYGDAITLARAEEICQRLKAKRFASINVVFGIGSYTYQYNTRDTFGYAMKSTACKINGVEKPIFKDPKTDDGTKKSQKGRVVVLNMGGVPTLMDGLSLKDVIAADMLQEVYRDGKILSNETFEGIRARLRK